MWNWNNNISPEMNVNKNIVDNFKKYSKIGGSFLIVIGLLGVFFPTFMSLSTLAFAAYLMLFAGFFTGWMTWVSNKKDWAGWLKSFVLILVAMLMLFYPLQGIAALGLLFSIYFFTDAFASFGLAFSLKPQKIWWVWLVNAVTSLVLGVIFVLGWPMSSVFLVGLFVGISLFFDGLALLMGGVFVETIDKDDTHKH